jgi:hypothetical protein
MTNSLIEPRSLSQAFAASTDEVASLLRRNNLIAAATVFGQSQILASAHDTNNRLHTLLAATHETNASLLIISDDITRLRRSSKAVEKLLTELLARDSLQSRMEEFIYQLEKMVSSYSDSADVAVAQYLAFSATLGVIAEDNISTQIIRGRDNKKAFECAFEAAQRIHGQLADQPAVKHVLAEAAEEARRSEIADNQRRRTSLRLFEPRLADVIKSFTNDLITNHCLVTRALGDSLRSKGGWGRGVLNGPGAPDLRDFAITHGFQPRDYFANAAFDYDAVHASVAETLGDRLNKLRDALLRLVSDLGLSINCDQLDTLLRTLYSDLADRYCIAANARDVFSTAEQTVKRWAKDVWNGGGEPAMREFALLHGWYTQDNFTSDGEKLTASKGSEDRLRSVQLVSQLVEKLGEEFLRHMKEMNPVPAEPVDLSVADYIAGVVKEYKATTKP